MTLIPTRKPSRGVPLDYGSGTDDRIAAAEGLYARQQERQTVGERIGVSSEARPPPRVEALRRRMRMIPRRGAEDRPLLLDTEAEEEEGELEDYLSTEPINQANDDARIGGHAMWQSLGGNAEGWRSSEAYLAGENERIRQGGVAGAFGRESYEAFRSDVDEFKRISIANAIGLESENINSINRAVSRGDFEGAYREHGNLDVALQASQDRIVRIGGDRLTADDRTALHNVVEQARINVDLARDQFAAQKAVDYELNKAGLFPSKLMSKEFPAAFVTAGGSAEDAGSIVGKAQLSLATFREQQRAAVELEGALKGFTIRVADLSKLSPIQVASAMPDAAPAGPARSVEVNIPPERPAPVPELRIPPCMIPERADPADSRAPYRRRICEHARLRPRTTSGRGRRASTCKLLPRWGMEMIVCEHPDDAGIVCGVKKRAIKRLQYSASSRARA
ncbi:MAG: hypothetical protein WC683_11720 [bacterium]